MTWGAISARALNCSIKMASQPFFRNEEQLIFKFRSILRKFSQNYCSHPTFANDLHGATPDLGNTGTNRMLNLIGLSRLCKTDPQGPKKAPQCGRG